MKVFAIRNKISKRYWRTYLRGTGKFVQGLTKCKLYGNVGDARRAYAVLLHAGHQVEIVEFTLTPVGEV